jgi:hypothetical protein
MSLKRKNANWEFSIHLDYRKGPNRITFDPTSAERFFKKVLKRNPEVDSITVKVKHLNSNLVWETNDPGELNQFIYTIVNRIGILK